MALLYTAGSWTQQVKMWTKFERLLCSWKGIQVKEQCKLEKFHKGHAGNDVESCEKL